MDYGHDLLLGSFPTPSAADPREVVALAQLAERSGLDLVGVQDHPYLPTFLDSWTLLSWIAASTERITAFPDVVNLPLRPPAVLARSVASLDRLSGGRVELGLGAGAFWDGIAGNGGPRRSPAQAVTALEEAVGIIRGLWTGVGSVRVTGEHYQVAGAKSGPRPAHDVGIWLGAYGPRMLEMTGRLADGWVPTQSYAAPEELPRMNRAIDEAAQRAGRTPASVRRLYNIAGAFGSEAGFLQGSPAQWARQLADLALRDGMSGFLLASDSPSDVQRFGEEVAPALRELVTAARGDATG